MPDVDQIMVAEGDELSPGTEEVKYESVSGGGGGGYDPDSLPDSTTDTGDNDLFITKESGGWVKKSALRIWNYIKSKLGIASSGNTFLRKDGAWATPENTTYNVVSTSENGLAPKVTDTSGYLKGDGTWSVPSGGETYTDFTYNKHGLVPSPGGSAKNTNHYLFDDGTWGWVENQTVDFTTGDSTDSAATSWTSVSKVTSGSSLGTLMNRISSMMKNTRYLKTYGTPTALYTGNTTGITANQQFALSEAYTNYRYIAFVAGTSNNTFVHMVPVSIFTSITSDRTYGYIIFVWTGDWMDIKRYSGYTKLYCPRISTSGAIILTHIYGIR